MEPEDERTERGYGRPPASQAGQASPEWTGLALLVAALLAGLSVAVGGPASGLAHSVKRSILCAVSLDGGCPEPPALASAYGEEVSREVERLVPELRFEEGVLGMPVDFRTCRSPACAESAGSGVIRASEAAEPMTLFTRVIDCREGEGSHGAMCEGPARGNLYIHYWAYFPESSTFRGVPFLEDRGHHPHDWESTQVRIAPDGSISQRASSHAGYNHGRSVANWPSDAGVELPSGVDRLLRRDSPGGWGPWTGRWLVEGGSHAGNVSDPGGLSRYPRMSPGRKVRLIPLEAILREPLVRPAGFDPITPPWEKRVWSDPEAGGTG